MVAPTPRAFRQHHRGADDAALGDVLGGRGKAAPPRSPAALRGRRAAAPAARRSRPPNWRTARDSGRADRSPPPAGRRGRASNEVSSRLARPRIATDNWPRSVRVLVWPPTTGTPNARDASRMPAQHRRGIAFARGPDRIDHRDRPSAHGGDVGDIDHDAAPAGEPRIAGHELVHEAFDGEQQDSRRRPGSRRNRRRPATAESARHASRAATAAMSLLRGDAAARPQASRQAVERDGRRAPSILRGPSSAATGSRSRGRRSADSRRDRPA